jgi:ABC-type multidrug transport system ATPase subunit
LSVVADGARGREASGLPPAADGGSAAAPALRVSGAWKRFGSTTALAGVDLEVARGAVVGLVGPNGSGKTTLLAAAAGLTGVDDGSVQVAGAEAGSRTARARSVLVPDEPSGLDELSVTEYVALVHALWPPEARAAGRARLLGAAFGLETRRDQRLGTLSRGLRRQAAAVAALSLAPPLVLVDEATATLDPEAVVVLGEAVTALAARGCGILLATQDLDFAASVCHEVVVLHRGAVVDRGAPAALRARHGAASLEDVLLAALGERGLRERLRGAFAAL